MLAAPIHGAIHRHRDPGGQGPLRGVAPGARRGRQRRRGDGGLRRRGDSAVRFARRPDHPGPRPPRRRQRARSRSARSCCRAAGCCRARSARTRRSPSRSRWGSSSSTRVSCSPAAVHGPRPPLLPGPPQGKHCGWQNLTQSDRFNSSFFQALTITHARASPGGKLEGSGRRVQAAWASVHIDVHEASQPAPSPPALAAGANFRSALLAPPLARPEQAGIACRSSLGECPRSLRSSPGTAPAGTVPVRPGATTVRVPACDRCPP